MTRGGILLLVVMAGWSVIANDGARAAGEMQAGSSEEQVPAAGVESVDGGAGASLPGAGERVKVLKALVVEVVGRAQWQGDAAVAWREAQVDDVLEPGARVRTGRASRLALRVGRNATVVVDRNTRLTLPEIVETGTTLRTGVGLIRGRADFKVDRVGLTNDFSVVTPTSIIAVRGTGYGVQYGAFRGTEIYDVRTEAIAAIEARYVLLKASYELTSGSKSSDVHPDPVVHALYETFGPPRLVTALIEDEAAPEVLIDAFARNPVRGMRRVDVKLERLGDRFELELWEEALARLRQRIEEVMEETGVGDGDGHGYVGGYGYRVP